VDSKPPSNVVRRLKIWMERRVPAIQRSLSGRLRLLPSPSTKKEEPVTLRECPYCAALNPRRSVECQYCRRALSAPAAR
jgi:hypothetical protein